MKATIFPQANKILTAPPGQEDEVYDLPVWSDGDRCISCWQPTEEERAAIARGEPMWLWIVGDTHPPVAVEVGSPFDRVQPAPPIAAKETDRREIDTRTFSDAQPLTQAEVDDGVRKMVEP
jgi:hypothetical protein